MRTTNHLVSRRTVLKTGSIALSGTAVGTGALLYASQPAMAVTFQAWDVGPDVSITTTDGTIDEVNVDPVVTIEYSDFEPDREASIMIGITHLEDDGTPLDSAPGAFHEVVVLPGTDGSETVDLPAIDITDQDFDPGTFPEESFGGAADGDSHTTELSFELTVDVFEQEGIVVNSQIDNHLVTVENAVSTAEATVTGSSSTTLVSAKEVET